MPPRERRKLALKRKTVQLNNGLLYKMGPDHILRRCVMQEEVRSVLEEAHEALENNHMGPDVTARKVLLAGL